MKIEFCCKKMVRGLASKTIEICAGGLLSGGVKPYLWIDGFDEVTRCPGCGNKIELLLKGGVNGKTGKKDN